MNPNKTTYEELDKYLTGEMSSAEQSAFEAKMNADPDLAKMVTDYQTLLKGMERLHLKGLASKAYQLRKLANLTVWTAVVLVLSAAAYFGYSYFSTMQQKEVPEITNQLPEFNEIGTKEWIAADSLIPTQLYTINTALDTVVETDAGILFSIHEGAFIDENGKPVVGNISLEVREALDAATIIRSGLTTMSDGKLLETGGMFYLNARKDGKSLSINPEKPILADIPTGGDNKDMMLFDGERKADGTINWVNPKPIENFLVAVPIENLNFYPPHYLDTLKAMNLNTANVKFTDSLYLSFENVVKSFAEPEPVEIADTLPSNSEEKEAITPESKRIPLKLETPGVIKSLDPFSEIKTNSNTVKSYMEGNEVKFTNAFKSYTEKTDSSSIILIHRGISKINSDENCEASIKKFKVKDDVGDFGLVIKRKTKKSFLLTGKFIYEVLIVQNGKITEIRGQQEDFSLEIPSVNSANSKNNRLYLPPSRVLAIHTPEFNRTCIATREFEERMQVIHTHCSEDILNLYVRNLDKPLWYADSLAWKRTQSPLFEKFYLQKKGRVNAQQPGMEKLMQHYAKKSEAYRKTAQLAHEKEQEEFNRKTNEITTARNEHTQKEASRVFENFKEEHCITFKDVCKQLGLRGRCFDELPKSERMVIPLSTTGHKNIDRFVAERVATRTSGSLTLDGKTATVTFEEVVINVKNDTDFNPLFVYLIPDKLNSFIRADKKSDGIYSYKMNTLLNYSLAVVGYKDKEMLVYTLPKLQKGEVVVNQLTPTTPEAFKATVATLNATVNQRLTDDMQYFLKEVEFSRFIAKRKANEKLRQRLYEVVFPCYRDYTGESHQQLNN